MILIRSNAEIRLEEGLTEIVVDTDRDIELSLENRCDMAQVLIRIENVGKFHFRTFNAENSSARYLLWNASKSALETQEHHEVLAKADARVLYAELSKQEVKRKVWMALREPEAHGLLASSSLVSNQYHLVQDVVNFAPHTLGEIQNFAVILKGGDLYIDAIGKIVNGASKSQSHQQSRVMCFEEEQKSTIIPELIIDEDDVQASHAMTIGRLDAETLFYMQTRGLSVKQATALIAHGYLQPITNFLQDDGLDKKLSEELESELRNL
ncbi:MULTISPECIES: SufD family Fe-S cluster assembly protein [Terrabacteria group]|uniref:SufD family Fe-S cluster assembly protein n=1 Tax=Bacillati TaxID=1783272 RepID=UPI001C6E0403|nr:MULTISPECIES: SufD family Fe-S cluster assembly protein [Terrabacteria group]MBW9212359.1 SufD family Fe-S cluster assembly protein [Trueperella sp. zg.1013]